MAIRKRSPRRPARVLSPRRLLQDELRGRGLPLVLEPRVRARNLLIRVAPVLSGLALFWMGLDLAEAVAMDMPEGVELPTDIASDEQFALLIMLIAALLLVLMAPLAFWLTALLLRRAQPIGRAILAVTALVALFGGSLLVSDAARQPLLLRLVALTAVLAAAYLGIGTMLIWAGHRAVQEVWTLGPMISRVLPVLMVAVLFFFYNAEIWQIVVNLTFARTWAAVGVLFGLAIVLTVVNARDELTKLADAQNQRHDALPLRPRERWNLLVVAVLVTLIQILWFAVLSFVFFVLFGLLTISDLTAALWMGQPATRLDGVLALFPASRQLIQVSLMIAAFSGLNFSAIAGGDQQYRATFIDPVLDELRQGFEVRESYLRPEHVGSPEPTD